MQVTLEYIVRIFLGGALHFEFNSKRELSGFGSPFWERFISTCVKKAKKTAMRGSYTGPGKVILKRSITDESHTSSRGIAGDGLIH